MTEPSTTSLHYRVCTRTVMDTSDPDIRFDDDGASNYVKDFAAFMDGQPSQDDRKKEL